MGWLDKYDDSIIAQGGETISSSREIPEITVYGKKNYLQELDKQQQKYLADMAKFKQDSTQWVKANQAYQDSLALYKDTEEIRYNSDKFKGHTFISAEEAEKAKKEDRFMFYDLNPHLDPAYEYDSRELGELRDKIKPIGYIGADIRKDPIYGPAGARFYASLPIYKKPTIPTPPAKPTGTNVEYDPTYENLQMRPLWATMAKQDTTSKIGTLNPLDPLYEKGFTYGEAQKFPEEIRKQHKLDYPIYQNGGEITREDYLRQQHQDYLKSQAEKGRKAVTDATDKFSRDYVIPAIKTVGSFTPAGFFIGLADAYEAYQQGNTGWALAGAGMEALPYVGKVAGKAAPIVKTASRNLKKDNLKTLIYNNISPASYTGKKEEIKNLVRDIMYIDNPTIHDNPIRKSIMSDLNSNNFYGLDLQVANRNRNDAWKLYLGIDDKGESLYNYNSGKGTYKYNPSRINEAAGHNFLNQDFSGAHDLLTSNAGGVGNIKVVPSNHPDVHFAKMRDTWDLQPFKEANRSLLSDLPFADKFIFDYNPITDYREYKKWVPDKLKNLEIGEFLGVGKPFTVEHSVPYTESLSYGKSKNWWEQFGGDVDKPKLTRNRVTDRIVYEKPDYSELFKNNFTKTFQKGGSIKESTLHESVGKYAKGEVEKWLTTRYNTGRFEDQLENNSSKPLDKQLHSLRTVKPVKSWKELRDHSIDAMWKQFPPLAIRTMGIDNFNNMINNAYPENNDAPGAYSEYSHTMFANPGKSIIPVMLHEATHSLGAYPQQDKIKELISRDSQVNNRINHSDIDWNYMDSSDEIYSRMMEFRLQNHLDPKKIWRKEDLPFLKKIDADSDMPTGILNFYDDDTVLKLLNEVAENSYKSEELPQAKYGGTIPKAQEGKTVRDFLHKAIGVPLALNQFGYDLLGGDASITEKSLTDNELTTLRKVTRNVLKEGKKTIGYDDYSKEFGKDVFEAIYNSSIKERIKDLKDPSYNLAFTLGNSAINISGNDTIINDRYNFNQRVEPKEFGKELLQGNYNIKDNPYFFIQDIGHTFGSKEGEGSPIKINISQKRNGGMIPLYAEGGSMSYTPEYIEQLKQFENRHDNLAYHLDNKKIPTIGWGHRITEEELKRKAIKMGKEWIPYEKFSGKEGRQYADKLMELDVAHHYNRLERQVGKDTLATLPPELHDVLLDITYNRGSLGDSLEYVKKGDIPGLKNYLADVSKGLKGGAKTRMEWRANRIPLTTPAPVQVPLYDTPQNNYVPKVLQNIVQDNEGYRNQENYGKPVQITSNQSTTPISMQGVPFPILAMSDTGELKIMMPGEEHEFEGGSVTEVPMKAQNGVTLPSEDFMNIWTTSPMHSKMLERSSPKDYNNIQKGRLENLANTSVQRFKEIPSDIIDYGGDRLADSNPDTGVIRIFDQDLDRQKGLITHEKSHSSDRPLRDFKWKMQNFRYNSGIDKELVRDRLIPQSDIDLINKFKPKNFRELPDYIEDKRSWENAMGPMTQEDEAGQFMIRSVDYYTDPTEVRARLNDLREKAYINKIYNPLKEKVSSEQFRKLISDPKIRQGTDPLMNLQNIFSDDEIMIMLNLISENQDNSNSVTELPIAQKGLTINNKDLYNQKRADELGYVPDSTGHMPSRDYRTGLVLKHPAHPTFNKGIDEDRKLGYTPMMDIYSNIYTVSPKDIPTEGYFSPSKKVEYQEGGIMERVNSPKEFFDYYIKSPKYSERLSNMGYTNQIDEVIESRLKNLRDAKLNYISNPERSLATQGWLTTPEADIPKQGVSYNYGNLGMIDYDEITAHELSHLAGAVDYKYPTNIQKTLNNRELEQLGNSIWSSEERMTIPKSTRDKLGRKYAPEIKANMDALRYMLWRDNIYDAGKEDFNKNTINLIKQRYPETYKSNGIVNFLLNKIGEDNLIDLMNNIAQNQEPQENTIPMAQEGDIIKSNQLRTFTEDNGWLSKYKEL